MHRRSSTRGSNHPAPLPPGATLLSLQSLNLICTQRRAMFFKLLDFSLKSQSQYTQDAWSFNLSPPTFLKEH